MGGEGIEISAEADLERVWPELRRLLRDLIDYHEPLTGQRLLPDWEKRMMAVMGPALRAGHGLLLLARAQHQAVGFLNAHVSQNVDLIFEGKLAFIDNAYLTPQVRGRRIASRLVEAAEEWFRANGATEVELNVVVANEHGRRVWQALGYEPHSERRRKRLE